MRALVFRLAVAVWLAIAQHGWSAPLVFDLTDPREAARWFVEHHNPELGPGGFHNGAVQMGPVPGAAPASMLRNVDGLNAGDYNRVIVELKVASPLPSGLVGTAFFFGPGGEVDADSGIYKTCPIGERQTLVFDLDQSLLWAGRIGCLRFDPVMGEGLGQVYSIKLAKEPPPPIAPEWDFRTSEGQLGWQVGEFDEVSFHSRKVNTTSDGMVFEATGNNPVIQHYDLSVRAELVASVNVEVRNNTGKQTQLRVFWATAESPKIDPSRSVIQRLAPGDQLQAVRLPLSHHVDGAASSIMC